MNFNKFCQLFESFFSVHRDIKATNVLLLEMSPNEYNVKISDFGLGKLLDSSSGSLMSVMPEKNSDASWDVPESKMGKYVSCQILK